MVSFSQKYKYTLFVLKKIKLEESHCTGEKAMRIAQLLRAWAEEAEVAPVAKKAVKSYVSTVLCNT